MSVPAALTSPGGPADLLVGPGWKLLVFSLAEVADGAAPPALMLLPTAEEALPQAYGLSAGLVLIRPDGYLALIGAEAAEVTQYFTQLR